MSEMVNFGRSSAWDMRVSFARNDLKRANGDVLAGFAAPNFSNRNTIPSAPADTGVFAGTLVMTNAGYKKVGELATGDVVETVAGRKAAIRHVLPTPTTRSALRLLAPYFGLDQDLIVGSAHRIQITSDVAEYLFGEETILVPAWALRDDMKVEHVELRSTDRLLQVQLNSHDPVSFGRCPVESLPKAGRPAGRILDDAEARSFAAERRHGIFG